MPRTDGNQNQNHRGRRGRRGIFVDVCDPLPCGDSRSRLSGRAKPDGPLPISAASPRTASSRHPRFADGLSSVIRGYESYLPVCRILSRDQDVSIVLGCCGNVPSQRIQVAVGQLECGELRSNRGSLPPTGVPVQDRHDILKRDKGKVSTDNSFQIVHSHIGNRLMGLARCASWREETRFQDEKYPSAQKRQHSERCHQSLATHDVILFIALTRTETLSSLTP